jgi:HD-GYP domain-containing protein (c-di-GMP phosphodiesterase class II)
LGKIVKHDVVNAYGAVLIAAGSVIEEDHLTLLQNHSIDLDTIGFISSEAEPPPCEQVVSQTVSKSRELFESIRTSGEVPVTEFKEQILPAVLDLKDHSNVFRLFQAVRATDEYTYRHNIGVGVLAGLIGKWMGLPKSDIATLSLAATLHDVGKVHIPVEILNKPGKLTHEEFELVKKHTIYGFELLREVPGLDPRIPLVAYQHHERNDGSGYPLGLTGDRIELWSKITAVADIFHAMSSRRPYHEPLPFHEIVAQMREGVFGVLDPNVVTVFLKNITTKLVGENVVLTDGRIGEIVYIQPFDHESAVVKCGEEFIDLGKRKDLRIKEIGIRESS